MARKKKIRRQRIPRGSNSELYRGVPSPLVVNGIISFDKEGGPAWELLQNAHRFSEWVYLLARTRPALLVVDRAIRSLDDTLSTTWFLHCAIQQSPRRNISGRNGALLHLNRSMPRSTAYKFLYDLGFHDRDDFRRCKSMEEVIESCPLLQKQITAAEGHYQKLCRSRVKGLPPLYSPPVA